VQRTGRAAGSRLVVPQRLTRTYLWLQQGLFYCCCLRLLLFLRRPVPATSTLAGEGKRPFSWTPWPRLGDPSAGQGVGGSCRTMLA
jgi:hypothetical protein